MRLKPICASIILLGLSSTAFAATPQQEMQLQNMQSQINQMEQMINQNNGGTQSGGGTALQRKLASCPNWYDSISVSGLINVDGILSSRRADFLSTTEGAGGNTILPYFGDRSASDLALDNADLFVDAQVNSWTKAHIGLNYQNNNNNNFLDNTKSFRDDDSVLNLGHNSNNSLIIKPWMGSLIDEAYVTFGDFCRSPFYFRVGKQYVNFGNYDRFATVPTFTQLLSQTNETAATLGFVMNGFYGSIYGFRGLPSRTDNSTSAYGKTVNVNNWGANFGWSMQNQKSSLNLQAGYLNNMADVDYVSASVEQGHTFDSFMTTGYVTPVGAISLDATGSLGMFDAAVHYVTALSDFNATEIDAAALDPFLGTVVTSRGANPSAVVVGVGATTMIANHKSRFGLDYQYSWDALYVGMYGIPQARAEGTFDMNVSKNVNVGLYVYHDQDYGTHVGGTGRGSTTGVLHLGVMFA
jgi:hypothetical protein